MKLISKIVFGFSAFALAACSSDEPVNNPNTPVNPDGEVAYMAITISAPEGTASRSTDDDGYEASWNVADEHKVNSLDFYFFEANGAYAFSASASTDFDQNGTTGKDNVEYIGQKQILILNGVRTNEYPEYVITVVNKPADFVPGATMEETAKTLATYATKSAFVMTTSSYFGNVGVDNKEIEGTVPDNTELRHDGIYYATKLNKSDFKTTVAEASDPNNNPVQIYVERLDAKIQLSMGLAEGKYEQVGPDTYYKLDQTLGGGNNNTGTGNDDIQSDVDLYVKVIGWNINAVAQKSYMSKQLKDAWKTTAPQTNWAWNNAGDFRSFWAQAWTYGVTDDTKAQYLSYITPEMVAKSKLATQEIEGGAANYTYCYENTNEPENIFASVEGGSLTHDTMGKVAVKNALATHVVLHTQICVKNGDGTFSPAGELVQYRGLLYTAESYKNLLLNRLKNESDFNFYVAAEGTELDTNGNPKNGVRIDGKFLTVAGSSKAKHALGEIEVSANAANTTAVYKRVEHAAEGETPAKVEFVPYTNWAADLDAALETLLASDENVAVGSDEGSDAFYYIPIEHHALVGEENAVEGYYGVVRNHWYKLTVNSFKKVGHLVYDPDNDKTTEIIPEGPEDPLYYVGAKINILSWKVVNQTVTDL